MIHAPARWLLVSTALEILASSLLGYIMLIPMQPWGKALRGRWPAPRALMSVHLDLITLALMQGAAGVGIRLIPTSHDRTASILLITSGWLNVTPYAWRLAGVNAFALAGSALQKGAALTGGWVALLAGWM